MSKSTTLRLWLLVCHWFLGHSQMSLQSISLRRSRRRPLHPIISQNSRMLVELEACKGSWPAWWTESRPCTPRPHIRQRGGSPSQAEQVINLWAPGDLADPCNLDNAQDLFVHSIWVAQAPMKEQVDQAAVPKENGLASKMLTRASRQQLQAVPKAHPASLSIARANFQFSLLTKGANHGQEAQKNEILHMFFDSYDIS